MLLGKELEAQTEVKKVVSPLNAKSVSRILNAPHPFSKMRYGPSGDAG